MITKDSLISSITSSISIDPEQLAESILADHIYIGKHVYVISRKTRFDKKVIHGVVTKITIGKNDIRYFSVEGCEEDKEPYYQGSFVESSIGRNVFNDKDAALKHIL